MPKCERKSWLGKSICVGQAVHRMLVNPPDTERSDYTEKLRLCNLHMLDEISAYVDTNVVITISMNVYETEEA